MLKGTKKDCNPFFYPGARKVQLPVITYNGITVPGGSPHALGLRVLLLRQSPFFLPALTREISNLIIISGEFCCVHIPRYSKILYSVVLKQLLLLLFYSASCSRLFLL